MQRRTNLQIVDRHVIAGEVQHAVEQRASVTVGQHEPVTVVLQKEKRQSILLFISSLQKG